MKFWTFLIPEWTFSKKVDLFLAKKNGLKDFKVEFLDLSDNIGDRKVDLFAESVHLKVEISDLSNIGVDLFSKKWIFYSQKIGSKDLKVEFSDPTNNRMDQKSGLFLQINSDL